MSTPISNVIGFDDAPFVRTHRGRVRLIGAICARTRLDGVVSGWVQRDGTNATERMIELVRETQFRDHVRAVLLQGITVAGFNVVDVHGLATALELPVLVVCRRRPNLVRMRTALFEHTSRPERRWQLIERAGPMEPLAHLWVQRVGIGLHEAAELLRVTTLHGHVPEALRLAHLIAGGTTSGKSRGRA